VYRNRVPQFCRDLTCFHGVYLPFTYLWFQAARLWLTAYAPRVIKQALFFSNFCYAFILNKRLNLVNAFRLEGVNRGVWRFYALISWNYIPRLAF